MDVMSQTGTALLACCVLSVLVPASGELFDSACDSNKQMCYYLYKDSKQLDVTEAFSRCTNAGQTLATVEDQKAQDSISKLTDVTNQWAWLAAKISDDNEWRTLDGKTIKDINYEPGTGFRCSAYQPTTSGSIFFGVPCRIPPKSSKFLRLSVCQSTPEQGKCPERTRLVLDNCYAVLPNGTYTAFDGNTVCASYITGSTLAYTGISEPLFLDFVRNGLAAVTRNTATKLEVWTGVFRRPWVWLQGALSGTETPIKYTNWQAFYGTEENGRCLSISLNTGKPWINKRCNASLQWYICQGQLETTVATKEVTTTTAKMTVVSKTDAQSTSVLSASRKTVIIIASVTTIMVIIIVIASILICLRYSSRRKSDDGGDEDELKDYNYIENPAAAPGSVRASELSPSTVGDNTNRDLTPLDFDLLSGTRRSQLTSNGSNRNEFFWGQNE